MEELVTQECLDAHPLKFMDGSTRYQVDAGAGPYFKTLVQLPMDVECDYCVIQWTYVAGKLMTYSFEEQLSFTTVAL